MNPSKNKKYCFSCKQHLKKFYFQPEQFVVDPLQKIFCLPCLAIAKAFWRVFQ